MVQRPRFAGRGSIAAWLLFTVVALAPLPFGSNQPVVIAFWCIVLGVCLLIVPMRSFAPGQKVLIGVAVIIVSAYMLVLYVQLVDHPWLAVTPDPVWHEAETTLGVPLRPSISVVRNQPLFELGRPLVCVLALACGFLVGRDRGCARQLIKIIAWSGATYAAYGILARVLDPTHILWREKEAYFDALTSTFINRNTAGAYFGSCAVVWSLFLWERVRHEMPPGRLEWRRIPSQVFFAVPKKLIVSLTMLFLCLTAMFMTGSRGATVLSLLALIVAFTAYFRRDLPHGTGLLTALAGGSAVALVLLQFLGAGVNARFDSQGLADEGRFDTYRSTLRMIADHPWFGTGLGTFPYAFPAYRSPAVSIWGVWDMAHNTLLEIGSDMGVPIAVLVALAWIGIFATLIRGTIIRRRSRLVSVAALAIAVLAALHSLIDFPLQIPGYAIVALSLIGAGLAQSFPEPAESNGTAS
jgi:O-antigen ligase